MRLGLRAQGIETDGGGSSEDVAIVDPPPVRVEAGEGFLVLPEDGRRLGEIDARVCAPPLPCSKISTNHAGTSTKTSTGPGVLVLVLLLVPFLARLLYFANIAPWVIAARPCTSTSARTAHTYTATAP